MENGKMGIIHCTGVDADTFLQGQLSADITVLTQTQGALACYLNLKGRVVALICVIKRPDGFWLVLPHDLIPSLLHKLKKFIVFSKATLTDISDHYSVTGIIGPALKEPAYRVIENDNTVTFLLIPERGLSLFISPAQDSQDHISPEFLKAMFEAHLPWIGLAQSEQFLPHYINLVTLGAVNFEKGCFVGQEVVARMHYRGHPEKTLSCLEGVALDENLPKDDIVNQLLINGKVVLLKIGKSSNKINN